MASKDVDKPTNKFVNGKEELPVYHPEDKFGPFTSKDVLDAFHAFDLDSNNYIGAAELRYIFKKLEEEVQDEEIDEMIRMVDTDGDGQVSFPEFQKMIFKHAQQAASTDDKLDDKHEQEEETSRTLDSYDSDSVNIKQKEKKQAEEKKQIKAEDDEGYTTAQSKKRHSDFRQFVSSLSFSPSLSKFLLFLWTDFSKHVYSFAKDGILNAEQFENMLKLRDTEESRHLVNLLKLPNGKIQIRDFLICAMITCNEVPRTDKIKFFFDLFDKDSTGILLESSLPELLRSVYLAANTQQISLKSRAFIAQAKHTKNVNDLNLNTEEEDMTLEMTFDDFHRLCDKFPSLLFPSSLTGLSE